MHFSKSFHSLRNLRPFLCLAVSLLSIFWTGTVFALPVVPLSNPMEVTHVAEGFKTLNDEMPAAVIGAWESTFFVHTEGEITKNKKVTKSALGTAFLVGRLDQGESSTFYFLTNYHVIRGFCDSLGPCSKLHLAPEGLAELQDGGPVLQILKEQFPNEIEVMKFSETPDLALLKTTASRGAYPSSKPLPLSPSCDLTIGEPLYTIGFAVVGLRKDSKGQPSESTIFKRWSSGVAVSYINSLLDSKKVRDVWLATTADVLPGSSGGPLLTARGEIAGVVEATVTSAKKDFRYFGSEDAKSLKAASYHITCESVTKFLGGK